MRKIYAFFAAALMSVSVFAAKDVVPSDAVLADYYDQGNVCVCFFVPAEMNCNDIVITGSFNGWASQVASCVPVEPVEGYDGWYVGSFEPEAEPSAEKGMQAKPIMLDADGNFNWEYQVGAATVIRGGVTVVAGYSGEIDLINYGADAPNVFTVDAWKQNPCTAVFHNYTITVISDGCNNYVLPYIAGSMTSWTDNGWTQMQLDMAKTQEYQAPVYYYSFKAAEGSPYQIVSGLMDPQTGLPDSLNAPGWKDEAYIQVLVDDVWSRYEPNNSFTGTEANIVYDFRVDTMRWARCAPAEDSVLVELSVKFPALNCPQAIEVSGTFNDWAGTTMAFNASTDYFTAEFNAKPSQFFKFHGAGSWDQEIEVNRDETDTWSKIDDGELVFSKLWEDGTCSDEPCKKITLDFSDPDKYRWTGGEQGIENVVLTEKAHKVMVDGVMYIIRDNKMFNVQGTQVR
jgi:hypothetical protein